MADALLRSAAAAPHPLSAWWQGLSARERRLLFLAASAIGLLLLWWVAVAPAWRSLRDLPAERAKLAAVRATMQAQAEEARQLRALPRPPAGSGFAALQTAVGRLEGRAKLLVQGQRATLELQRIQGDEFGRLLGEIRTGARARVIEASLQQQAASQWSGRLVLDLPEDSR